MSSEDPVKGAPEPIEPAAPVETPAAKAEAARIRRRWLTLGEILAVAAVAISGLTFWNSYEERRDAKAERLQEEQSAAKARSQVGLIATQADGSKLTFKSIGCALQSTDIVFPTALGIEPQNTVLEHRIEADWFEDALLKITPKDRTNGRLPIAITSRCTGTDGDRVESAIYDIVYRIQSRVLLGRTVKLRGMTLVNRLEEKDAVKRLDVLWARITPPA